MINLFKPESEIELRIEVLINLMCVAIFHVKPEYKEPFSDFLYRNLQEAKDRDIYWEKEAEMLGSFQKKLHVSTKRYLWYNWMYQSMKGIMIESKKHLLPELK